MHNGDEVNDRTDIKPDFMRKISGKHQRRITTLLNPNGGQQINDDNLVEMTTAALEMPVGSYMGRRKHTQLQQLGPRRSTVRRNSMSMSLSTGSGPSPWELFKLSQVNDPNFKKLYNETLWWYTVCVKFCGFMPLDIVSDRYVNLGGSAWSRPLRRALQLMVNWSWFMCVLLLFYYLTAWQSSRLWRSDTHETHVNTVVALLYISVDFYGIGILLAGVFIVHYQQLVTFNAKNYMAHIQFPLSGRVRRDDSTIDISLIRLNPGINDELADSLSARQIHFREWRRLQVSATTSTFMYMLLGFFGGNMVIYFVLVERGLWIHERCREALSPLVCSMIIATANHMFTFVVCMWTAVIWIAVHILHRSGKHLRHAVVDIINEGHRHHIPKKHMEHLVSFLGDWLAELAAGKASLEKYLMRYFVPLLFVLICGLVITFTVLIIVSRGEFPQDLAYYTAPALGLLLWSFMLACLSRFFRIYSEIDELMFLLFCPSDELLPLKQQQKPKEMEINVSDSIYDDYDKELRSKSSVKDDDDDMFGQAFRISVSDTLGASAPRNYNVEASVISVSNLSQKPLKRGSFIEYVGTQDNKARMEMFRRQQKRQLGSSSSSERPSVVSSGENCLESSSRVSFSFNANTSLPYDRMLKWGMVSNAYQPAPQVAHRILLVYLAVCKRVVIGFVVGLSVLCIRMSIQYPNCVKLDVLSEDNQDHSCSIGTNIYRIFEDVMLHKCTIVLIPSIVYVINFGVAELTKMYSTLWLLIVFLVVQFSVSNSVGSDADGSLIRLPSDIFFLLNLGLSTIYIRRKVPPAFARWWHCLGCLCIMAMVNIQRFVVIFNYNRATEDDERVVIIFATHPLLSLASASFITMIMRLTHAIPGMKHHFAMFSIMSFIMYPIQRFYIINLSSAIVQLKSSVLLAFVEVISRTISLFVPYVFWLVVYRSHVKALAQIELTRLHVVNRHHICINMMVEVYSIIIAPIFTQIVRATYDKPLIPWPAFAYVLILQLIFSVVGDVIAVLIESVYLERKVLPLWNYFLHTERYLIYGIIPAILIASLLLCRDIIVVVLSVSKG